MRLGLLCLLVGCSGGMKDEVQLPDDFVEQLDQGLVCPRDPLGNPFGQVLLMNADATVRMQINLPDAVVFVGEDLDAYLDDDACDDLVIASGMQTIRMAYTLTTGTVVSTEETETVRIQFDDAVLTPDALYAEYADFTPSDANATPEVQVGDVDFGSIRIGVALAPVE